MYVLLSLSTGLHVCVLWRRIPTLFSLRIVWSLNPTTLYKCNSSGKHTHCVSSTLHYVQVAYHVYSAYIQLITNIVNNSEMITLPVAASSPLVSPRSGPEQVGNIPIPTLRIAYLLLFIVKTYFVLNTTHFGELCVLRRV